MARPRIDVRGLTFVAVQVVDDGGLGALTLASVADELGVRPSALYTYVDNLAALRQLVAVHSTEDLTSVVRDSAVGRSGDEAIAALAHAYRGYAVDRPGRYASTLLPPIRPDDELSQASAALLAVFARVLAGRGFEGDDAVHAARATRAAIHGFVGLETSSGFDASTDADESFDRLIGMVIAGLG